MSLFKKRTSYSEKQLDKKYEKLYKIQCTPTYRKISDRYFSSMKKIESRWSVMINTGTIKEMTPDFISLCRSNIEDYKILDQIEMENVEKHFAKQIPACKRLAMLYGKLEMYQQAADICVESIFLGGLQDGSSGGMQGRLARMIKKGKLQVTDSMQKALEY